MEQIEAAVAALLEARDSLTEQLTAVNQALAWLAPAELAEADEEPVNDLALEDDETVNVVGWTKITTRREVSNGEFALVDAEPARPKRRGGPKPTVDYEEIAAWINAAKADGTYSQQAMEDRYGLPRSTVKNYITKCRKLGLLDQEPTSGPKPAAVVEPKFTVAQAAAIIEAGAA